MTVKTQVILTIFTTAYLLLILLSDISLVGYWIDIVILVLLVLPGLWIAYAPKPEKNGLKYILRLVNVSYATVVLGGVGLNLVNPFAWDTLKTRSFHYEKVDGRLFHAYFQPLGAYAGGEGRFWITETPLYFPIIEIERFHDGAVLWDFRATEWEGQPVDQNAVVKEYIRDEVITQMTKK